jgi:hypothetical protein
MNAPANSTNTSQPRKLHSGFFQYFRLKNPEGRYDNEIKDSKIYVPVARTFSKCPIMVLAIEP